MNAVAGPRTNFARVRAGVIAGVALCAAVIGPWQAPASAAGPQATESSAGPLSLLDAGCVESFDGLANGNGAAALPPGAMFHEDLTNSDTTYFAADGGSNTGDTRASAPHSRLTGPSGRCDRDR